MNVYILLIFLITVITQHIIAKDSDSDAYSYNYKSLVYEKEYTDSPSNIYTNYAGNLIIVSDTLGNVMRTTDYGKTWDTSKSLYNGKSYLSIAGLVMNKEGDEMFVSTNSDEIFYSKNYGETFHIRSTSRQCSIMAATNDLETVVCIGGDIITESETLDDDNAETYDDDDGQTIFGDDDGVAIDGYNHNYLYYSKDSGYTWHKSDAPKARWVGLLSNSDGSWIIGVVRHKLQYTWASSDGGKTYSCINDEGIYYHSFQYY